MRREEGPAYGVLRPSARRLLKYVISVFARSGGGRVVIHNDQLEMIGSRRIYLTGLYELHTVGLLDVERFPKCHACQARIAGAISAPRFRPRWPQRLLGDQTA